MGGGDLGGGFLAVGRYASAATASPGCRVLGRFGPARSRRARARQRRSTALARPERWRMPESAVTWSTAIENRGVVGDVHERIWAAATSRMRRASPPRGGGFSIRPESCARSRRGGGARSRRWRGRSRGRSAAEAIQRPARSSERRALPVEDAPKRSTAASRGRRPGTPRRSAGPPVRSGGRRRAQPPRPAIGGRRGAAARGAAARPAGAAAGPPRRPGQPFVQARSARSGSRSPGGSRTGCPCARRRAG